MPKVLLSPAQRKERRAEAHHLDPVVLIGADGLTPAVEREIDAALTAHGLIKVRVASDERTTRETMWASLAETLSAAPIQHIGKLLVLWRAIPPKERVEREGRGAGVRVVKIVKFSKSGNHRPQVKKVSLPGNMRIAAGGEIKRARKRRTSIKKTSTAA